jgi:hypothetical protein
MTVAPTGAAIAPLGKSMTTFVEAAIAALSTPLSSENLKPNYAKSPGSDASRDGFGAFVAVPFGATKHLIINSAIANANIAVALDAHKLSLAFPFFAA